MSINERNLLLGLASGCLSIVAWAITWPFSYTASAAFLYIFFALNNELSKKQRLRLLLLLPLTFGFEILFQDIVYRPFRSGEGYGYSMLPGWTYIYDTTGWLGIRIAVWVIILISSTSIAVINLLFSSSFTSNGKLSLTKFNSWISILSLVLLAASYFPSFWFIIIISLLFCLLWQASFMVLLGAAVAGRKF